MTAPERRSDSMCVSVSTSERRSSPPEIVASGKTTLSVAVAPLVVTRPRSFKTWTDTYSTTEFVADKSYSRATCTSFSSAQTNVISLSDVSNSSAAPSWSESSVRRSPSSTRSNAISKTVSSTGVMVYRSVASSKNVTSSPSRLASVSSPRVYFRRNADVISMTESDVITIGSLELSINRSTVSVPGSSAYCLTSADVSKNRVQIRSSRPSSTILLRGFSTSASGAVLSSRRQSS